MKIAVVGSHGLLGNVVYRLLSLDKRYEVYPVNRYMDKSYKIDFDYCVNCNGSSLKYQADIDPAGAYIASVDSTYQLIRNIKAKTFIHISSVDVYSGVYGNHEAMEIHYNELGAYGKTKFLAEQAVQFMAPRWNILRCCSVIGPGLKKGIVYDLLNKAIMRVKFNTGIQLITSEEIASIIATIIDNKIYNNVFNVCGEGIITVDKIAEELAIDTYATLLDAPYYYKHCFVDSIKKIYPVKSSIMYLRDFMREYNCT